MQSAQQGMILGGDLYFDFLTAAGVSTGFELVGNATKLIPKVETETLDAKLNGKYTLGQIGKSFTRISDATISFSLNIYDPKIVAAYFMGSAVDITAASGTYTATITGILNKWVPIGHNDLTTCTVKDETDTTTYIANTDYEVNTSMGMIRVLSSAIDGDTLHISGDKAAASGFKITGATSPVINVGLYLDGKNYVEGNEVKLRVWQAQIRADGDFDLLAQGGFPELAFSGKMITPAGKSWPFELI
ncbi:hypothetical protein Despr_2432 [Desulfobulbus propionicus DSM 2032]|uniref:Uncharacterized protein n=1 Tax=Desulfobulbus propionicus (strain ATCC 33891 / DSM 2032 / VKM B-1956 / 1pr3) TaxID=577650 RepID=A0A7U4DPV8_DESPD|nr:hypothetical protein [Desulfobulbus propionicus]ADW18571.1 hypothetical protein Despr_2432 [Desulfobulbus propionicus DSM 2032]